MCTPPEHTRQKLQFLEYIHSNFFNPEVEIGIMFDKVDCFFEKYLKAHYPEAEYWPAKIVESDYNVSLDSTPGCSELTGYAIDENKDGNADRFLWQGENKMIYEIAYKDMGKLVHPLICEPPEKMEPINCSLPSKEVFPGLTFEQLKFRGRLLPDSKGKITELAMVDNHMSGHIVEQLKKVMPHVDFKIFGDRPNFWFQDTLFAGFTEFGQRFISQIQPKRLMHYVHAGTPLAEGADGLLFETPSEDGGNIISTSTHVFVHPANDEFSDETAKRYASDRKIIKIPKLPKSAAHLDMILTPLEDKRYGKPVVLLACPRPSEFAEMLFSSFGKDDKEILAIRETIKEIYYQLKDEFHIIAVPYIVTPNYSSCFSFKYVPCHRIALSFNNVLIERYVEDGELIKKAYIPYYADVEDESEKAAAVYEDLGYEVIPIHGLESIAGLGGSLRCMTKVTNRAYVPTYRKAIWD